MLNETVGVVIPYKNNVNTLPAVLAGLNQSTICLHVYVVDDASIISAEPLLRLGQYAEQLSITYLLRKQSVGVSGALNTGIRQALKDGCRYIAINDADDVSYTSRFEKQRLFLEQNTQVGAVSAWAQAVNEQGAPLYQITYPAHQKLLNRFMFYNNGLVHPAVMYRAEVFAKAGLYDENITAAVDYDMMRRIQQFYCLANIPEILLDYMIRSNSISVNNRLMQTFNRLRIQLRYFAWGSIHAYAGIVRTLIALLLRVQWLNRFKKWRVEKAASLGGLIGIS